MKLAQIFDVTGKRVVVTGAASGIGLGIAEGLAENGARVALLDIAADQAEAQAERLRAEGYEATASFVDVTDPVSVDAAIDACAERLGGIDVLFANAGIDPGSRVIGPDGNRSVEGALENYAIDKWHKVIGTSLDGVFYCVRAAARHMKPQKSGSIVITTSVSSVRAMPIGIAYSAAKAGAAHFMRNAALELAAFNVRVNAIAPGPFVTGIGGGLMREPAVKDRMTKMIPLGRVAEAAEMKGLALFLSSSASNFMTGAELFNDGGLSLGQPV